MSHNIANTFEIKRGDFREKSKNSLNFPKFSTKLALNSPRFYVWFFYFVNFIQFSRAF